MPVRYTPEQREWMERHYAATPNRVLAEQFSERFGERVTKGAMNAYGTKHGLRKAPGVRCSGNRRYTDEQLDFLREFVPGHTEREIIAAFAERFGVTLNRSKVKNLKTKLGVRSGTVGGRFEKGLVPANKGKTWDEFLSPEAQERSRKTTFKKGNRPHNAYRKLLDEKTDARGTWVYVKPRKRRYSADDWVSKQRFVWMQANGRDWPEGCRAVFADHDPQNFDPENVVPVPDELYAIVSGGSHGRALPYHDRETLELAIAHARVIRKRGEIASMAPRICGVCGKQFVPDEKRRGYGYQVKTCPECLAKGKKTRGKRRGHE
jgi:hypothetical protein